MVIAKLKKDILSKNYPAAGKLFLMIFALISEPITADRNTSNEIRRKDTLSLKHLRI